MNEKEQMNEKNRGTKKTDERKTKKEIETIYEENKQMNEQKNR